MISKARAVLLGTILGILAALPAAGETGPELAAPPPQPSAGAARGADDATASPDTMDLTVVEKKLDNPVTNLWSLAFQYNHFIYDGDLTSKKRQGDLLNFQPALAIPMTENWHLTVRPVFPITFDQPVLDPADGWESRGGLGDIQMSTLLGMNAKTPQQGFAWGVGPAWVFPSATDDGLGQGKWQAGPGAVAIYRGTSFTAGLFWQQWWSFAGARSEPATSSSNIQPILSYYLPDHWGIGMSPNILVNWKAGGGNELTLPLGGGITKLFRIGRVPVKAGLICYYSVVRPDKFAQEWDFRFIFIPVIPSLIREPLFE